MTKMELEMENLKVMRRTLEDVIYAEYFDPVKAYFAMLSTIENMGKMIERNKKKGQK